MKINPKQLVKQIRAEKEASRMRRVNLYLNANTYAAFVAACKREKLPASLVVEKLMQEFMNQQKTGEKK